MNPKGLTFKRYFTNTHQNVFDSFEYELRDSLIKNPSGEVIYEINDVEVPKHYSQIASDIVAQKYLRKAGVPQEDGKEGSETSIKQVAHRLVNCWKVWGIKGGYFASDKDAKIFYDELVYCVINQNCAPNSPQWFNTGLFESYGIKGKAQGHYYTDPEDGKTKKSTSAYERPQPHACFILSVKDDLINDGGIMDLWVREARIFKYGSGVGTNFSQIRSKGEPLSGGGTSSGLMSFLRIGDRAAGAIKSGGTTRRAAKMVCLDVDHPEILDFINWKKEEEEKAQALIQVGYPSDYEGEAYNTVSGQNSNNSVRVTEAFMQALENNKEWELRSVQDKSIVMNKLPAHKIWESIASSAWRCADPGLQFDTTINEWHTCPQGGPIRASNPCSEYMFLDNTACNLASINLEKYLDPETLQINVKAFEHTVRLWTVVLEISVFMAQFPSKEVALLSYKYRTLGLGYANLGTVLMISGIPYNSDFGRAIAASITSIMTGVSYRTSAEMAAHLGPFPEYKKNKVDMLRIMQNHLAATYDAQDSYVGLSIKPQGIDASHCPDYLLEAAQKAWSEAVTQGKQYGYRNAQTTVIAPTGTIGLVMDCDTTGVEPDLALVKYKKLAGGGYFKIVNQSVPRAINSLKYSKEQASDIVNYIMGKSTLEGCPHINIQTLTEKGFSKEDIQNINNVLPSAFDIRYAFTKFSITQETLRNLNITEKQTNDPNFSLLEHLQFNEGEISEATEYIYGTGTIEGAPHIANEHLAVFDTANKCGKKGKRYIHASGHILMMAATQPFISGAISKTINLPNEATKKDISESYLMAWKYGLKAVALYRDGSKSSQPLSSSNTEEKNKKEDTSLEEMLLNTPTDGLLEEINNRLHQQNISGKFKNQLASLLNKQKLPAKRKGFTYKAKIDGQAIYVRTGEYDDGTLGEIFIDLAKEGSTLRSLINCFAIATSVGLRHGVPLEDYVEKFIFTKFLPAGAVDHPNIKMATSIVDFVFRLLAFEYLGREDLVHVYNEGNVKKNNPNNSDKNKETSLTPHQPALENEPNAEEQAIGSLANTKQQKKSKSPSHYAFATASHTEPLKKWQANEVDKAKNTLQQFQTATTNEHNRSMQSDAPSCNVCGHITVRNGTCYKCLNCGNSLGCS